MKHSNSDYIYFNLWFIYLYWKGRSNLLVYSLNGCQVELSLSKARVRGVFWVSHVVARSHNFRESSTAFPGHSVELGGKWNSQNMNLEKWVFSHGTRPSLYFQLKCDNVRNLSKMYLTYWYLSFILLFFFLQKEERKDRLKIKIFHPLVHSLNGHSDCD